MFKCSLFVAALGCAGFWAWLILTQAGLPALAGPIVQVSSAIFFSSLMLLFFAGMSLFLKRTINLLSAYLPVNSSLERKAAYLSNKLRQQKRLFEFKKAKLIYLAEQKRRLLFKKRSKQNTF